MKGILRVSVAVLISVGIVAVLVLLLSVGSEWIAREVTGAGNGSTEGATGGGEEVVDSQADDGVLFTMESMYYRMPAETEGDVETLVTGDTTVVHQNGTSRITNPVVVLSQPGQAQDASFGEVRLTAKSAVFDQEKRTIRLHDSVKAEGSDFDIAADDVYYVEAERSITSPVPVELNRYRLGAEGERVLAMTVTGNGLEADLIYRTVFVRANVKTMLFGVSGDFMMGSGLDAGGQKAVEVVITSDGPMTYDHLKRKASFETNVVAKSGNKTLEAQRLVFDFGKSERTGELQIAGVTAEGDVTFQFPGQKATGQKLEWANVTQAGTLTGQPAVLEQPDFRISGGKLTFLRLNSRFDVEGPGNLLWSPPQGKAAKAKVPTLSGTQGGDRERAPSAPIPLAADKPVKVVWQGLMNYDATSRIARFQNGVKAAQGSDSLLCDALGLQFSDQNRALLQVVAEGNVHGVQTDGTSWHNVECDVAQWDTQAGTIELSASEGKHATVSSGDGKLVSSQATFHPAEGTFDCPGAGTLMLAAGRDESGKKTAEPLTVRWQESMSFHRQPDRFAEFHGAVEAGRPGGKASAEHLRVDFDDQMNALTITATKNAVLEVRRQAAAGQTTTDHTEAGTGEVPSFLSLDEGTTDWRVSGEVLIGEPPKNLLHAPGAGLLELLREGRPNDTVQWTDQMTSSFAELSAGFEGEVDARFSGSRLQCEKLGLEFNEGRQLRYVSAKENVRFQTPGEQPWQLRSESAEAVFIADSVLSQVIAQKKVVVQDASRTLACQVMKLFFEQTEGQGRPSLSQANASGDVSVHYKESKEGPIDASCDRLEWDSKTDDYTLTGNPAELKQGGYGIQHDEIVIDRTTGRMLAREGSKPAAASVEGELR